MNIKNKLCLKFCLNSVIWLSECHTCTQSGGYVMYEKPTAGLYLRCDHRWVHRLPSRRGGHCFTTCRSSAWYVRGNSRLTRLLLAARSTPRITAASETIFCYYSCLLGTPITQTSPTLYNLETTQLIIRINISNDCYESQIYCKCLSRIPHHCWDYNSV
jgi:hypothetical protein